MQWVYWKAQSHGRRPTQKICSNGMRNFSTGCSPAKMEKRKMPQRTTTAPGILCRLLIMHYSPAIKKKQNSLRKKAKEELTASSPKKASNPWNWQEQMRLDIAP